MGVFFFAHLGCFRITIWATARLHETVAILRRMISFVFKFDVDVGVTRTAERRSCAKRSSRKRRREKKKNVSKVAFERNVVFPPSEGRVPVPRVKGVSTPYFEKHSHSTSSACRRRATFQFGRCAPSVRSGACRKRAENSIETVFFLFIYLFFSLFGKRSGTIVDGSICRGVRDSRSDSRIVRFTVNIFYDNCYIRRFYFRSYTDRHRYEITKFISRTSKR